MEKTGRRATRRYTTLGAGLEPDFTTLRGREKSELYMTHESKDASRN